MRPIGMLLRLSNSISSTRLFSRSARAASKNLILSVAMRPGTITLAVIPKGANSLERVFDQACSEARKVFEMAKLGMGVMAPEDVLVMKLYNQKT